MNNSKSNMKQTQHPRTRVVSALLILLLANATAWSATRLNLYGQDKVEREQARIKVAGINNKIYLAEAQAMQAELLRRMTAVESKQLVVGIRKAIKP